MKRGLVAAIVIVIGLMAPGAGRAAVARQDVTLSADLGNLDAPLAEILPEMLVSALESAGSYRVRVEQEEATEAPATRWDLEIKITGKGPWRLAARAKPRGQGKTFSSKKVSFRDAAQLGGVVDALARELDQAMGPGEAGASNVAAVVPLAEVLSPSQEAREAYLRARAALRSGRGDEAARLLDEALSRDPGFVLAAAERAYMRLTAAGPEHKDTIPASDLRADVLDSFDHLVGGRYVESGSIASVLAEPGHPGPWPDILRALSASLQGQNEEAEREWRSIASVSPHDPRPRMWLGRVDLAEGRLEPAAEAFRAARQAWPGLLMAYTLEAEAQVRERETFKAREIVDEMKQYMESNDLVPPGDDRNPWLMLGSVDLMEGRISSALSMLERNLALLRDKSVEPEALRTMLATIVEIRRDMVRSRDRFAREREFQEARAALDQYSDVLQASDRQRPWDRMRLDGLLTLKEGDTVEGWKILEEMQALADRPGYSKYDEEYLAAAITLKEGDVEAATSHFESALRARGRLVDLIDVAQMQSRLRRWDEARNSFQRIGARLERYDPARGYEGGEIILAQPRLSALTPIYHYARAQLGYMTGDVADSRLHFNRMLKYLAEPDESLLPLVKEALGRGARPE